MNKKLTNEFDFKFDMIFAAPPYFPTVEYRCRAGRSCALIKEIGTKVSRKMA